MAVSIAIQETTITPTKGGLLFQLYVSDAPRESESAAMRLALTATIPDPGRKSLQWMQVQALTAVRESIQETINDLYQHLRD
jgi:hypothetical protein